MPAEGLRLIGGGVKRTGGDNPRDIVFVVVSLVNGKVLTIFPEVAAKMACLASYRAKDVKLTRLLKLRACEWAREVSLSWVDFYHGFHGSVEFALLRQGAEQNEQVQSSEEGFD
jgi:hypothetical protein